MKKTSTATFSWGALLGLVAALGCGDATSTTTTTTPSTGVTAGSCAGPEGRCIVLAPTEDDHATILAALLEARPGDVLYFRAGFYDVRGQLSLDVDDVTLRGEGMDETILSFRGQESGGEGLLVFADNFTIEDMALEDSHGDLIRVLGAEGLYIRRVRAEWTNGPDEANGAYGIYPIQCDGVLIEDSVAIGASDAGIYVGQSKNIIVRRNRAEFNVAGIEIENSQDADVYENVATNNTGGILVFNLPGPPVKDGRRTRVFRNVLVENNTPNFAPPGNIVGAVPAGTGFMLLANDEVEVFDNEFRDNDTVQILSISFNTASLVGGFRANDPGFDPYSETISVYGNTYIGGGENPDPGIADLVRDIAPAIGTGPFPRILIDGDEDRAKYVEGGLADGLRHCIEDDVSLVNLDVARGFQNPSIDRTPHDCSHSKLGEVVVPRADDAPPRRAPDDLTPISAPTEDASTETRCEIQPGDGVGSDPDGPACNLLSSYRLFADLPNLIPNDGVIPYDLNTPLFSDYSTKLRFVYVPPGTAAEYRESFSFEFPVGTVLIKNFTYPYDLRAPEDGARIIETRLLLRRSDRWIGVTYVWNEAGTEAVLKLTGETTPVGWQHFDGRERTTSYGVPNANQCKACHNEYDDVTGPLGPKARNLNKDFAYGDGVENQLDRWTRLGILTGAPASGDAPRSPRFEDPTDGDLDSRARAYLDVNCGNCHNPRGLARPSGLNLTVSETDPTAIGVCKSPIAAGRGSGGFRYGIEPGAPERSILLFRMRSSEPGVAMPELGRQLVHEEAIEMLSDWIRGMDGTCD